MKIRSGFVSNSSSSSFIIAVDKPVVCECCGQIKNDIRYMIHKNDYYQNGITLDGVEEVLENMVNNRKWIDDFDEKIKKITDASNSGKEVLSIEVSNHDEELRTYVHSDKVEILFSDEDENDDTMGW
jgi:hypothetical protein